MVRKCRRPVLDIYDRRRRLGDVVEQRELHRLACRADGVSSGHVAQLDQ
jgi:hypothetical protein